LAAVLVTGFEESRFAGAGATRARGDSLTGAAVVLAVDGCGVVVDALTVGVGSSSSVDPPTGCMMPDGRSCGCWAM
jgi:hypothetical protein